MIWHNLCRVSLSPRLTDGEIRPWLSDFGVQGHVMPVAVRTPRGWRVTCPPPRLQCPWGAGRGRCGALSAGVSARPSCWAGRGRRETRGLGGGRKPAAQRWHASFLSLQTRATSAFCAAPRAWLPGCGCAGRWGDGGDGPGRRAAWGPCPAGRPRPPCPARLSLWCHRARARRPLPVRTALQAGSLGTPSLSLGDCRAVSGHTASSG